MKEETWRSEWHPVTNSEAHAVTGSTTSPNHVYRYPVSKLPSQLQKMPGLYDAYISGYVISSLSPEGISALGEVAAIRAEDGIGKSYVFVFGVSGSGVYFNGPYKGFESHHFENTGSIPVDKLFGNVPPYPEKEK